MDALNIQFMNFIPPWWNQRNKFTKAKKTDVTAVLYVQYSPTLQLITPFPSQRDKESQHNSNRFMIIALAKHYLSFSIQMQFISYLTHFTFLLSPRSSGLDRCVLKSNYFLFYFSVVCIDIEEVFSEKLVFLKYQNQNLFFETILD